MPWGSPASNKFITNVGLITSNGQHGENVMSAEWTHHISYEPALIMVNIDLKNATADNILKTMEFGVNIAAEDQNLLSSIAGQNTGKEVDKIALLKELGFEFYKAKTIDVLMVKDAALNLECKVTKHEEMGDHIMFIGEVLDISVNENVSPILYNGGKYYKLGEKINKPQEQILEKIKALIQKHKKA